jgi:hypothetical protein
MSKEQNLKAFALGAEIFPTRDFDRFGEFFAEHIVDHDPADGQPPGRVSSSGRSSSSATSHTLGSSTPVGG